MLAFVLIVAVAAIALDSSLFCVDGCDRNDAASHQTTQVPCASCVTCQPTSLPETRIDVAPPLTRIDVAVRDSFAPLSHRSTVIEHPPRTT
jgi:hypothetical protein